MRRRESARSLRVAAIATLVAAVALCASSSPPPPSPPSPSPPPQSPLLSTRAALPAGAAYLRTPRTCLPWQDAIAPRIPCGSGEPQPCNVSALAAACDATPGCNAFNSNGFLKSCAGGRCDCDSGPATCARGLDIYSEDSAVSFGCDHTDLYVLSPAPAPPAAWAAAVAAGTALYGSPEARPCFMPEVGNGYLATSVGWGALYVGGLFNGGCGSVRKARLPSPVALTLLNASVAGSAAPAPVVVTGGLLDTRGGVYYRWLATASRAGAPVTLQQAWYAHRARRNLLVTSVALTSALAPGDAVELAVGSLWAMSAGGAPPPGGGADPGDGCAGGFSQDLTVVANSSAAGVDTMDARTSIPGDRGELFNLTMVVDVAPATLVLDNTATSATFLAVVATSLDQPAAGATADVHALATAVYAAAASAGPAALAAEHASAWAALVAAGIDVEPAADADADGAERARDIARHASSSLYYLLSAVRADWPVGISPGGISSGSYSGAVFMDMDVWMQPPLVLLAPALAAATLEYRAAGFRLTDAGLAALFGYEGGMAAWTAAYEGRPFGCCAGTGGYEDCLEQHVTGDIAWAAWQFYSATGNASWLASTGWPILAGAADFHLSRVTPRAGAPGTYSLRGVLPVDEWCVDAGCGCETPGVDDDAQMNAVARLSLLKAAAAAAVLGNSSAHSARWAAVGAGLSPLFNESGGHHNQFDSPSCPGGWGGSHYTARHTICPVDTLLLSYPFGEALAVPLAVTAADAALFIPLTCRENAGMTTPIHSIVQLVLGNAPAAEADMNRSMHAAAYGPFNVRNEVDKHPDVIGADFDNAKFLTGDGGFLQLLMNGYGALRVVDEGLRLRAAPAPPGADAARMRMRGVTWHGRVLELDITRGSTVVSLAAGGADAAIVDGDGVCAPLAAGASAALAADTYPWPALIVEACPATA